MGKDYTKQHIVPVCYLNRFATKRNRKYLIKTKYKKEEKKDYIIQSTANVGYIKDYYDVTDKSDPKYWEHYFANKLDILCDRELTNIISSICLAGKNFTLNKEEKKTLSEIIVSQMLRVPSSFLHFQKYIYPEIIEKVKVLYFFTFPEDIRSKLNPNWGELLSSEQSQKNSYLNSSFSSEVFSLITEKLMERKWIIYINTIHKEKPFFTCDNPVVLYNKSLIKNNIFNSGIMNPQTTIFFPITPAIAVFNCHTYYCKSNDGSIITVNNTKFIESQNNAMFVQAYQHTFIPLN